MKIFKNKDFDDWTHEIGLEDSALISAIEEVEQGLFDANLGGHIYKKRIAIGNRGKSASARTIIAFKSQRCSIFIYGFKKNKRDNITDKEQKALKLLANLYFSWDENKLNKAVKLGELIEVKQP